MDIIGIGTVIIIILCYLGGLIIAIIGNTFIKDCRINQTDKCKKVKAYLIIPIFLWLLGTVSLFIRAKYYGESNIIELLMISTLAYIAIYSTIGDITFYCNKYREILGDIICYPVTQIISILLLVLPVLFYMILLGFTYNKKRSMRKVYPMPMRKY